MKKIFIALAGLCCFYFVHAQKKYYTKTGTVSFEAGTSVEDVNAINKSVSSIFDASSGQYEFALLINGFEFRRALMQQHFNEDYMESDKYPKAFFKGVIVNISSINFSKDGSYPGTVKGTLTIHNVSKEIEVPGTFIIHGGNISAKAQFNVALADYNISVPGLVKDKISKTVKVFVDCSYTML